MSFTRYIFALFFLFIPVVNAQEGWTPVASPLAGQTLGKVQFADSERGCITVDDGRIIRTADGGKTWDIVSLSPGDTVAVFSDPAYAMSFVNGSKGWVIGTLGGYDNPRGAVIFKTMDGGGTWSKTLLSSWKSGLSVHFIDENTGWATAFTDSTPDGVLNIASSALLKTTDGGTTWTKVSDKIGFPVFVDANTGWMVSDSLSVSGDLIAPHEIFHTTDGGATWVSQYRSDLLVDTRIHFTDADHGWVVSGQAILHTTDGGANWVPVTNTGILLSGDTRNMVMFLDANNGWIGSHYHPEGHIQHSEVKHTTDGGATWTTQSVPDQSKIFSIFFSDPYTGWIVFDSGAIARMTGGGPVSVEDASQSELPARFLLGQNFPNPFNPSTTISFTLPSRTALTLHVYDATGRVVTTLASGTFDAGEHSLQWNAAGVASGVYFYRLRAGNTVETRKLTLVK